MSHIDFDIVLTFTNTLSLSSFAFSIYRYIINTDMIDAEWTTLVHVPNCILNKLPIQVKFDSLFFRE